MQTLITNISSLVTVNANGQLQKCGSEMQDIGEIRKGAVLFDEKIIWTGKASESWDYLKMENIEPDIIINAKGKTVLPGLVDSHTHFVFAGSRSLEYARRLRGATYKEIAAEGGGILTTVNAVRNASVDDLYLIGMKLAESAIKHGTTAVEIKSGYGLTLESEIKMLEAIRMLRDELPISVSATFLGAHDFPPEYRNDRDTYVNIICSEMLPTVAEMRIAEFCDVFIDEGYYTLAEGEKIMQAALDYGFKLKIHCDELASFGAAELSAVMGAVSADHLLFVSDTGINEMKKSGTIASLLPGTAYFIRMPYAPARKIIEGGCAVALATDCNPGSCFTENMQLILSLAVTNMNMTAEEAIAAATLNGAAALCKSGEYGSIEVGKKANLIMANVPSYIDLMYHFGINHVTDVWSEGKKIV